MGPALKHTGISTTDSPNPLAAFRTVDVELERRVSHNERLVLSAFRLRLVGELLGDTDLVVSTLTPDFVLTTLSAGEPASTTDLAELKTGLDQMSGLADSFLMWMEFDHFLVDGNSIAGSGHLNTATSGAVAAAMFDLQVSSDSTQWLRQQIAFFVDFDGSLMTSETLFIDPRQLHNRAVTPEMLRPKSELRAALGLIGHTETPEKGSSCFET